MIAIALSILSLLCIGYLGRIASAFVRVRRELLTWHSVVGAVYGYEKDEDGGGFQHSLVAFFVDGREYVHRTLSATTPPSHRIGERLTIFYDPDRPDRNLIPTWSDTYGPLLLSAAMPLIVLSCSLAGLFGNAVLHLLLPALF